MMSRWRTPPQWEALERQAKGATCAELGHDWQSVGGCNCGCHEDAACCIPVNECARCKECDYGDNREAEEVRRNCRALSAFDLTERRSPV